MPFQIEEISLPSRSIRSNQTSQQFGNMLDSFNFLTARQIENTVGQTVGLGIDTLLGLGIRQINSGITFGDEFDNEGGILGKLWKAVDGVFGCLAGLVKAISFSASQLVGWIKGGWNFLVNFDWNASDETLINQMKNANLTLASVWGGFVGEVLGTGAAIGVGYLLTIGIGAGLNIVLPGLGALLTPTLARAVAFDTLKERLPEIWDTLTFALYQTASVVLKNLATSSYILIRRALKNLFPEQLANWGNGERWTIAESFGNWIEDVTGIDWINTAAEEAAEEFDEAFWETGFVFAHNLDEALRQAQLAKEEILGKTIPQVTIELDPDSNEKMILPDQPSNLAKMQVLNEINTFRKVRNRDIGYFTGEKVIEESRRFNFLRTGKVTFRGVAKPPFGSSKQSTITLKDLKPNLRWRDFKEALDPYNWGPHFVWCTLNRSRHEIGAWFATIQEGELYLKNLIRLLINDEIIAIDAKTEVDRNTYVKKSDDIKLMYPAFLVITIKTPVSDQEDATHDLAGNSYEKELKKIPLWQNTEPSDIDGFLT